MNHKDIQSIPILFAKVNNRQFTFVIPTYRRVSFLKETIDSVLANSSDFRDFNIVVLDNNPERNDETEIFMCRTYSGVSNLSYYKNAENLGMIGNWNRAFVVAKSKYVILLHDDDLVEPDFLKYVKQAIDKIGEKTIGIIKPMENRWKDNGIPYEFHSFDSKIQIEPVYDIENYYGFKLGAPTGCLFERESVISEGGFFESFANTAADFDFFIRMNSRYPCYRINLPLVVYRISTNESFKLEIQYLGVERCYKIVHKLLKKYFVPNFIFYRFYNYFLGDWARMIRRDFCPDFSVEEAKRRIHLKSYPVVQAKCCNYILNIYVRMILLLRYGKFKPVAIRARVSKILNLSK